VGRGGGGGGGGGAPMLPGTSRGHGRHAPPGTKGGRTNGMNDDLAQLVLLMGFV